MQSFGSEIRNYNRRKEKDESSDELESEEEDVLKRYNSKTQDVMLLAVPHFRLFLAVSDLYPDEFDLAERSYKHAWAALHYGEGSMSPFHLHYLICWY